MTVTAPPSSRADSAGPRFKLTARRVTDIAQHGGEPICRRCALLQAWWLEQFTLDELLELGDLLGWR